MTQYTLGEIADRVGGQLTGNRSVPIHGPADIAGANSNELSFVANSKYFKFLETTQAGGVILAADAPCSRTDLNLIRVANPNQAFAKVIELFAAKPLSLASGIHPKAEIAKSAKLGANVRVGAFAVICENAIIGDETEIHPGVFIGPDSKLGKNCSIHPNVTIRERVTIGDRALIHPGVVIGSDGFGFDMVGGKWVKVQQCGTVVLEDDVEIGANCTIDRARFGVTRIGRGTKFDNQVQIGHNVDISHDSLLIAQVGVAGSTKIGHHVIIAGQAGIAGHLNIGDGAKVAGQSGVGDDVPAGAEVGGVPSIPFSEWVRMQGRLRKISEYSKNISQLNRRVEELEKKLEGKS